MEIFISDRRIPSKEFKMMGLHPRLMEVPRNTIQIYHGFAAMQLSTEGDHALDSFNLGLLSSQAGSDSIVWIFCSALNSAHITEIHHGNQSYYPDVYFSSNFEECTTADNRISALYTLARTFYGPHQIHCFYYGKEPNRKKNSHESTLIKFYADFTAIRRQVLQALILPVDTKMTRKIASFIERLDLSYFRKSELEKEMSRLLHLHQYIEPLELFSNHFKEYRREAEKFF
jgi:hypothetical protein